MEKSWRLNAVLGILLVIINIIFFAIPFPKTFTFWISDFFIIVALFSQLLVTKIAYKNSTTLKSKVYGFPISYIGVMYFIVVFICAIVLISLSCVIIYFPYWISIVIYFVLTGIAGIGLIATDSTRNYIENQDVNLEIKIDFMKKLTTEALALKNANTNPEMYPILNKVYEELRFSDPVSSPELFEYDNRLNESFNSLKNFVLCKDKENIVTAYEDFHQQLVFRNTFCKNSKK